MPIREETVYRLECNFCGAESMYTYTSPEDAERDAWNDEGFDVEGDVVRCYECETEARNIDGTSGE